MSLFVLESPNKVNKIQGFLGHTFIVTASKGHIRNLGRHRELGIDIDNNFTPDYVVDDKKKSIVNKLKVTKIQTKI